MEFEGVSIDVCGQCNGMWFDKDELSGALGGWLGPAKLSFPPPAARDRRCPGCYVRLGLRELAKGSAIEIDQCPKCSGVWLESGEFTAARRFLESHGRLGGKKAESGGPTIVWDEDSTSAAFFQYLTGLPLEINVPQTLFPPVVTALIVLNTAILALTLLSGNFEHWIRTLGAVPADISAMRNLHTLITSVFMHGGILHLVGNMYFLWVTGDNLEERFGPIKFLVFYLFCGVAAGLMHVVSDAASTVPSVGASGAISGMMGAYMVLFASHRFVVRWFFFYYPVKFEIPAYGYFIFWIALQILYASLGLPEVAWFAHIGGFVCGAVIGLIVRFYRPLRHKLIP